MKTTLVTIVGDWDGGHNGRYPLLLQYDSSNTDSPLISSEGWGHGYSGNSFTIEELKKYSIIEKYNQPGSVWAYEILKKCLTNGDDSHTTGLALLSDLENNKLNIPEFLKPILGINA